MKRDEVTKLLLCGDVMLGRGIDQALPFHCVPRLHEDYVRDARDYVPVAEQAHGPFPPPAGLRRGHGARPSRNEARRAGLPARQPRDQRHHQRRLLGGQGHPLPDAPGNLACLGVAGVHCCSLANNHVLDWGYAGLEDTLDGLAATGVKAAGAGRDALEAQAPAVHELGPGRRVLVFAMGHRTSGIPAEWAAGPERPGVYLLPDLSPRTAAEVGERMQAARRPGDVAIASIHWGANWGFEVLPEERESRTRYRLGARTWSTANPRTTQGDRGLRRKLVCTAGATSGTTTWGSAATRVPRRPRPLVFASWRRERRASRLEMVPRPCAASASTRRSGRASGPRHAPGEGRPLGTAASSLRGAARPVLGTPRGEGAAAERILDRSSPTRYSPTRRHRASVRRRPAGGPYSVTAADSARTRPMASRSAAWPGGGRSRPRARGAGPRLP
jgi:hypothetical protein